MKSKDIRESAIFHCQNGKKAPEIVANKVLSRSIFPLG